MELQQMRYVIAVAETNSFTRAAQRCLVVQSALSHQIARLERELGARLFERTSRRVRLTPAGAAFLPAARRCLDAAERAAAEVAASVGEVRGRLEVGLIPTVAAVDVPNVLKDFHRRHPKARISVSVGASDELVERVRQGEIEVAFLGIPITARPRGVMAREIARERLVAVVSPDHPLAGETSVDLRRLSSEVFVDLPAKTAGRAQSDLAFTAAGLTREVAFEVTNADYLARLVGAGLGVALLPPAYVAGLAGVATIEVTDAPGRAEYVIWGREGLTPAAAAFLELLGIEGERTGAPAGGRPGPSARPSAGPSDRVG
ncbi:LysR family transcriptional regulator [Streptomyces tirandamycinicus]|uniref:LysR family transcriptional regulator n=1 Tax=Streptomyces tirandamycinicus TaxID=2174846 RepID=UPI00226D84F4|nr:LysR family transcriptional regulator [Streptomyces tirandamycinicus]MCY0983101.1 LysR family transcriptional regulator [Streptomyces tirandamycinicus]